MLVVTCLCCAGVFHFTHLLCQHDDKCSQSGSSDTWNGEQLDQTLKPAVASHVTPLDFNEAVCIVELSGSLERSPVVSKERFVGFAVPLLADQPTRAFGGEPNAEGHGNCGKESRTELKAPSDCTCLGNGCIGTVSEEHW